MTDTFKQRPLKSMNNNLMQVGKALSEITPEKVDCLKAVVRCQDLVHWLKDKIRGKELYRSLCALYDVAPRTFWFS